MDSPTVATVQALVIMSATEAAFTRDARGWLYSGSSMCNCSLALRVDANNTLLGMATRLSADLGLHLDITKHINNGLLSQRDMEIRQTAFWGVFIHEQYAPSPSQRELMLTL